MDYGKGNELKLNLEVKRPTSRIPDTHLQDLYSLCIEAPTSDFAELGVYQGGSAWVLGEAAKQKGVKLHLFDTFNGFTTPLVKPGEMFAGTFADTSMRAVQDAIPEAKLYPGIFPDTMPADLKELGFIHVDCDIEYSCRQAIAKLWPLLVKGGIMAFDDWSFEGIYKPVLEMDVQVNFTSNKIPFLIK